MVWDDPAPSRHLAESEGTEFGYHEVDVRGDLTAVGFEGELPRREHSNEAPTRKMSVDNDNGDDDHGEEHHHACHRPTAATR